MSYPAWRTFRTWFLALIALSYVSAPLPAHQLTFHLAPESEWNGGRPNSQAFLPEGEVFLYRVGSYFPEITLPLNEAQEVPEGLWTWIAQAPGFVTVAGGSVSLGGAEPIQKTLIWPAVPACEIDLGEEPWRGVSRLDVVSLDHGATFPISIAERRRFNVPAGRSLAYTTDTRGISAFSSIKTCQANRLHRLEEPRPPAPDRQSFMLRAIFPEKVEIGPEELLAKIHTAGEPLAPSATLWTSTASTFFFLDLPAHEARKLSLAHPAIRTQSLEIEPLGGSARELPTLTLPPRFEVEIPIDYRPKREHRSATVLPLHCGFERRNYDPKNCLPAAEPLELTPGHGTYTFSNIDNGWLIFVAQIDGEELRGLGSGQLRFLSNDDPTHLALPTESIKEFHIYGHLLADGEAVEGEVLLEPVPPAAGALRRFPTDEADLTYDIFYFGKRLPDYLKGMLPEELASRPAEELYAIPWGDFRLRACDREGFCKLFHTLSTFTGDGRMDIDLGSGKVKVEVSDALSGERLEGATVALRAVAGGQEVVHFFGGELVAAEKRGGEALVNRTGTEGEVQMRGLEDGAHSLAVRLEGYEPAALDVDVREGEELELSVELEPLRQDDRLRFRLGDEPAPDVFLLATASDGSPDYPCSKSTDSLGQVDLPPACLAAENRLFAILHPRVVLRWLSAGDLARAVEIELEPKTGPSLQIRLIDSAGQPIPGEPVALHFPDLTLSPNHLLLAGHSGHRYPHQTDGRGTITFDFLDARGLLPELLLPERDRTFYLASGDPVIELIVD